MNDPINYQDDQWKNTYVSPAKKLLQAEVEAEYRILIAKYNLCKRFMSDAGMEGIEKIHAYQKVTPINTLIKEAGL